jgi:hypothetical protein
MAAAATTSAHARMVTLSTLMNVMVMGSKPPAVASKRDSTMPAVAKRAAVTLPQAATATILGADHKTLAESCITTTAGRRRRKIEMENTANASVKPVQMAAAAAHCNGDKGSDSRDRIERAGTGSCSWGSTVDCDHSASDSAHSNVNIINRIMTETSAAARRRNRHKTKDSMVATRAAAGRRGRLEPICCKIALVEPWGLEAKAIAAFKEDEEPNKAVDKLELAAAAATAVSDGKHLLESGVVG